MRDMKFSDPSEVTVGEFFVSNPGTHNAFKLITNMCGLSFTHIHCLSGHTILSSKLSGDV